jgi:hypothetical protein
MQCAAERFEIDRSGDGRSGSERGAAEQWPQANPAIFGDKNAALFASDTWDIFGRTPCLCDAFSKLQFHLRR